MEQILFSLNSVIPVALLISLGILLKKLGIINDQFIKSSSVFVFFVSLPALVFKNIAGADFSTLFDPNEVILLLVVIIVIFFIALALCFPTVKDGQARGSFIQGAFRSNIAIMGLAVMQYAFGAEGQQRGSILIAFTLPLFNILSVISLSVFIHAKKGESVKRIILEIIKNPLIIAVVAALPFSLLRLRLPVFAEDTISALGAIALPLSLVGIGGTLRFVRQRISVLPALISSAIKIFVFPLLLTVAALLLGIRGDALGVLFIFAACPSAVATFSMAQAMDNDAALAAEIIVFTTIGSIFVISLGLFALKSFGLI
jgi:predicted permease